MIEMLPFTSAADSSAAELPLILLEDKENGFVCADFLPVTTAFGGFKTWPQSKSDFILIAECSEISGPNPIFTIPTHQNLVKNLNALCIRLLSTDYQEFGSNKDVTTTNAQVLLPDIMNDVHAAVNHFTLYDAEARGFVRPFCIAYITSDKHKLLQLSAGVFKCLSDASSFIQQSNRKFCVDGLEKLMLDLELTKLTLSSHSNLQNKCGNPEERLKVYNRLIESCMKDIQEILSSVKSSEAIKEVDDVIHHLIQRLSEKMSPVSLIIPEPKPNDGAPYKPKQLKIPLQQNFDKQLKNLYHLSPGGVLLSLHHLHVTYKCFKRKYANIVSCPRYNEFVGNSKSISPPHTDKNLLYFGACLKVNSSEEDEPPVQHCVANVPQLSNLYEVWDPRYFIDLDSHTYETILDFLKTQNALTSTNTDASENSAAAQARNEGNESEVVVSPARNSKMLNGFLMHEGSREAVENNGLCCSKHMVSLSGIWDVVDHIKSDIPDIDSIVLEILRLTNQSESLLYSVLTKNLIVVLYSVGEELLARIFLKALAALVPQKPSGSIFVEHNRSAPVNLQELKNIAAVSYCLPCQISDIIPATIKPSVTVLNLAEAKYCGPRYVGTLLQDLNSSIRRLSAKDPVLLFLISILAEIELQLKLWQEIAESSAAGSVSAVYLLEREFTKCDIKIIENLSTLCRDSAGIV